MKILLYLGANLAGTKASLNFSKLPALPMKEIVDKKVDMPWLFWQKWSSKTAAHKKPTYWSIFHGAQQDNAACGRPSFSAWWAMNSFSRGSCMVKRPHSPTQSGDNITEGLSASLTCRHVKSYKLCSFPVSPDASAGLKSNNISSFTAGLHARRHRGKLPGYETLRSVCQIHTHNQ